MPVNPDIIFILLYFQKKVYRQSDIFILLYFQKKVYRQ